MLEPLEDRRLLATIGNFVWSDNDANGIQDVGEPGVSGVAVRLIGGGPDLVLGTADDTTSNTTTDANGFYQFSSLTAGTQYRVLFSVPAGYLIWTQRDAGADDTKDSDVNRTTGLTEIETLAAADNLTLDAGLLRSLAAIEGTLYYNLPGNVQQPIPGQVVSLYRDGDADGVFDRDPITDIPLEPLYDTDTTDAAGRYHFANLDAGTYFVLQPPEPSGNIQPPPDPIFVKVDITADDVDGVKGLPVDLFDDGEQYVEARSAGPTTSSGGVSSTTAVGGYREAIVTAVAGTGGTAIGVDQTDNNLFTFSEDANLDSTGSVIWDATPGNPATLNPTGLGGVDLTGGGVQNSFLLDILDTDRDSLQTLTVYTDATHASRLSIPVLDEADFTPRRILFADMKPLPGLEPADFQNVGAITLDLVRNEPLKGWDYILFAIETLGPTVFPVPLPYAVLSGIDIEKQTNGVDHANASRSTGVGGRPRRVDLLGDQYRQ